MEVGKSFSGILGFIIIKCLRWESSSKYKSTFDNAKDRVTCSSSPRQGPTTLIKKLQLQHEPYPLKEYKAGTIEGIKFLQLHKILNKYRLGHIIPAIL